MARVEPSETLQVKIYDMRLSKCKGCRYGRGRRHDVYCVSLSLLKYFTYMKA